MMSMACTSSKQVRVSIKARGPPNAPRRELERTSAKPAQDFAVLFGILRKSEKISRQTGQTNRADWVADTR